ncbi:hydantoinase/oxoprolinase family protein [Polyangium jinanense]|uniref:Hydantoinase/oxoprolinase family protein n=1 Tax=Polyangium jinanense TaxID=2829994 RepID=A0A9X3XB23_9BACT|nr:hydantoinase/oxoprolinase family protein [Polyangium jinanense]MDC3960964.1 hydantoinase/oxoprolinase family protein [Polyangium jinanense]MDC3987384.1 hydantoinase/oxoprolinase family protein [Polyangium jinanense]
MRVGIDVGGTHTDAVLMHERHMLGWVKRPTSADVASGVEDALAALLAETGVDRGAISAVMLGTTQLTNAVIERRGLARTAAVRLCLPAGQSILPFADWPDDLRDVVSGGVHLLAGGHEYDGREIAPLDDHEVDETIARLAAADVEAVALAGIFSPANPAHEEAVAERVRAALPHVAVTLSHEIGQVGLLDRENAALLNACLLPLAARVVGSLERAVAAHGLAARVYLTQNDGTLLRAELARRHPVRTFASGPVNSMRGAAFLANMGDAVVIDVGGTSTDVGMLVRGFPREAPAGARLGGVRVNFRMPDLASLALGGGSVVEARAGDLRIGPRSVGHALEACALAFGGDTLTLTDIGLAAGLFSPAAFARGGPHLAGSTAELRPERVAGLPRDLLAAVTARVRALLEQAVDACKTSPEPVPVIVVGGAAGLVPDALAGTSSVLRPAAGGVANAIGAAIAQASGEVDRIFPLERRSRDETLSRARAEAIERARVAGARPDSIEIVEVDEVPLTYLPGNAVRVRVKAAGDLAEVAG